MLKIKVLLNGLGILLILFVNFDRFNPALSCTTPVFRYALERWPAYQYEVEVIYSGNLANEQKNAIDLLKSSSENGGRANVVVKEKVVDESSNETSNLKLPVIRLSFPKEQKLSGIFWEGPLTEANARKIIDSPARQNAVRNIQAGDAVVWFFLEGGDKKQDDLLAALLKDQLALLSIELKLASTATDVTGKPLEIDTLNRSVRFSMVRISRSNPEEEIFIKMLLGTEADLASFDSPMAFPVFGRGRALYALVGGGINPKLLRRTCNSIIGWCSCTVKEENPGVDLLFTADWEIAVGDSSWIQNDSLPELTGFTGFLAPVDMGNPDVELNTNTGSNVEKPATTGATVESEIAEQASPEVVETERVIPPKELVIEKQNELEPESLVINEKSPLMRNIFIFIGLFIVIVPLISFLWRKKEVR